MVHSGAHSGHTTRTFGCFFQASFRFSTLGVVCALACILLLSVPLSVVSINRAHLRLRGDALEQVPLGVVGQEGASSLEEFDPAESTLPQGGPHPGTVEGDSGGSFEICATSRGST